MQDFLYHSTGRTWTLLQGNKLFRNCLSYFSSNGKWERALWSWALIPLQQLTRFHLLLQITLVQRTLVWRIGTSIAPPDHLGAFPGWNVQCASNQDFATVRSMLARMTFFYSSTYVKERECGAEKKERTRRGRKLDSILQKNILEGKNEESPGWWFRNKKWIRSFPGLLNQPFRQIKSGIQHPTVQAPE